PSSGAMDVLINADVVVTFTEEMNTSSVTYTCTPDPGGWSVVWSAGNTTATYSHNDFASETTYTFEITGGKDLADNDLAAGAVPNPWSFTSEDVIPPEISLTSPVNGTIDVVLSENIVVTFSEEMNTSTVTYTCTPDPLGWSVVWSGGNTIATYSHNPFTSTTVYNFEITGAKDPTGNDLVAGAVPNPWTFTTEDALAPTITSTSPANGSLNVAQTENIIVTFSEAMNTSSVAFASSPNPGGWFVTWSNGDTVATFSHDLFDDYTSYIFQITDGKDLADNNLAPGAVPNPWTFTTTDSISPSITATSPLNASVDIGLTQNVVVTFSEAIDTSSLSYNCFPDPGGWSVSWSSGDSVATFSHTAFLDSTSYTFQIANARDGAGNQLVGGAVPNPWTFTTIDATSPTIIGTSPQDSSNNIALTADIVVTFDEEMNTATVAFLCAPDPGSWSASWNAQNTVVTYSHNAFDELNLYTFQIVAGEDIAGNGLIAGAVQNPWSFTTEDITSPTITATTPADNAPNIGLDQEVIITFSEPLDNTTVTYTCLPDPGGWSVVWSGGNTLATFSHNQFDSNTVYTFQVTGAKDLAGNDLAAGAVPNPWSFSTVESIPPTITLTSPSDGSADVDIAINVTVTFSEAMNMSSVAYTSSPDPGGWSITWSAGDTVATISHNRFDKSTGYTFQIVSGKDIAGNNLIAGGVPNPWSFTTKANIPPSILSTPILTGTEYVQYIYDIEAADGDGDPLTYSLTTYPTGMVINTSTGLITWTPTNVQVGVNNVVVLVSDIDFGTDSQSFTITVANVNDPPIITSIPITIATEDVQYSYDVEASDVDVGDTLSYSLTTYPTGMTIDSSTGMILWTPTNSQVGANNILVEVSDGNGGSDTQSFTITVENANDAPTIISTAITTATEDAQYVYDVDATDIDVGDTLSYSLSSFPSGMTVDPNTGVITWIPTNAQVGVNPVTVVVSDDAASADTQSFTITVANSNDPPNIFSAPITTATEEILYTYDVEATDPDIDTLIYGLTTYPTGMAIDNSSGLITWTPTNSQVGSNSVVVLVLDGNGGSDIQSFTITVENANDPPSIISVSITSATEDQPYVYDVEATDIDVGDILTYSLTVFPTGMTIDSNSGLIEWTPTNDQVGVNSATVVVSDENGSFYTQSFTITVMNVNDPPTITSSSITTATEDVMYTYDVEATEIDVGDTLSYSLTTYPIGMTIDNSTGLIQWTPINDQVGVNNVVVLASDGNGGSDTQSFSIDVANTNDPPTIISPPITTATDDVLYVYDVEASDIDIGDSLVFSLTEFPTGMTIDPNTGHVEWTPDDDHVGTNSVTILVSDGNSGTDTQSYNISVADANDEPTITSTAPTTAMEDTQYSYVVEVLDPDNDILDFSLTTSPSGMTIDSATGLILWTPTNDQVGSNNVIVQVLDGNGGSDTQSFPIDVTNVNDAPMITSTPIITETEDELYVYDVDATDVDLGDSLTYSLTEYPTGMIINSNTGLIQWTPINSQVGTNPVTVVVSDESGSTDSQIFTITVSNTNDAPTFTSTPIAAGIEDMVYNYDVNATDMDIGDTLTYSLTTYPDTMVIDNATGMITWTPTNSDVGENPVTVKVMDGNGGANTQSFFISISNVNDPPIIISGAVITATQDALYTYDVDADDIDFGDTLTYSLTVFPEGMIINSSTGEISWSPANTQVGDNSVLVEVFDGSGEKDSQSFMITVANMNDPPTFTSQPETSATEEMEYFYEVEALDIDGDTLNFSLLNYPEGMVIDSDAGTITWTPTNAQVGTHPIIVKVIDGNEGDAKQSFSIIVENVNDSPTIISIPPMEGKEEVVYTYLAQAEDLDPDDTLIFELAVYPAGMQINSTAGIISWTPTNAQVGENSVIVVVTDGNSGSDTQSFVINVSNVNDKPYFTSSPITEATEDVQYFYDVNANDVDPGDSLTYSLTSAPEGMIINESNGFISWIPMDADVGTHQIEVKVTDNQSTIASQSFTITVENVNDAPIMSGMTVEPETGNNRDIFVFTLTYTDPDGDSGTAKVIINSAEYEMTKIGGGALTGEIFTLETALGARNHTYYFVIDDDEDHVVVSDVSKIYVTAVEVEEEPEDLLPIPEWWLILILILIIIAVLIYLGIVKRQLKRQRRYQRFPQKTEKRSFEDLRSVGPQEKRSVQKTGIKKADETREYEEPEEEEAPLLEFIR
ncbi:MAG: tandem-95 repeat protein, partial [Thermoplasmata archaeon]